MEWKFLIPLMWRRGRGRKPGSDGVGSLREAEEETAGDGMPNWAGAWRNKLVTTAFSFSGEVQF